MAKMDRNLNLEEIDSDALFGIDALKNQSMMQKIVFWGCLLAGMLVNTLLPIFFQVPRVICILIFLILLLVGVAIGCNYTEDMTYGRYMYYLFFKPTKPLLFSSTEDMEKVQKRAVELKKEEELLLQRQRKADPKAQRMLLLKLIAFVILIIVFAVGILLYSKIKEPVYVHHEIVRQAEGSE